MTDKLDVMFRVDLDGAWARILVQGDVTAGSVQAL